MAGSFPGIYVSDAELGRGGAEAPTGGMDVEVHGVFHFVVVTREDRVLCTKFGGNVTGHPGPGGGGGKRLKPTKSRKEVFARGGVL